MYFRDWVERFRFRQVAYDRVVIETVNVSDPPPRELQDIESRVKALMGQDVEIQWSFLDDIQPLSSGKYLYTICEIP